MSEETEGRRGSVVPVGREKCNVWAHPVCNVLQHQTYSGSYIITLCFIRIHETIGQNTFSCKKNRAVVFQTFEHEVSGYLSTLPSRLRVSNECHDPLSCSDSSLQVQVRSHGGCDRPCICAGAFSQRIALRRNERLPLFLSKSGLCELVSESRLQEEKDWNCQEIGSTRSIGRKQSLGGRGEERMAAELRLQIMGASIGFSTPGWSMQGKVLEVKADELGPDELMPVGEQRFTPWHRSYTNLKLQRNEKAFWVRVQVRTGNKCVKKKMLKYVQIIDELHQRDQAYNFMQRCEVEGLEFIAREIDESPDSQCAQTKIPPIAPDAAHTSPSSIQNFRPAIDDDTSSNRQTPLRHEPSEINPTKEDAFAALSVAPPSKLDFCKDAPNALVHQSPARTPNSHSQTIAVVKAAAPFPAANNHISMQYDGVLMNHGHQGPYVSHSHLPFQTGNASAASQAPDWNAHQLWQIQSFEAAIRNISYSFPTNCVTSSYPTAPSSLEPKGLNPQSNSSPSVTYPTAEKKIQGIRPNTSTLTNGTCNFQSAGNFDANKHGGGDNRAAVRDSADSASSETNALHRNGQGSPAKSTNNSAQWRSPRKKRKKVAKKEDSKPQEEPVCIVLSDGEGENHVEEKSGILEAVKRFSSCPGKRLYWCLRAVEGRRNLTSPQIKASVMFGRDDRVSLDSADQHGLVFSIAEARGAGVRERRVKLAGGWDEAGQDVELLLRVWQEIRLSDLLPPDSQPTEPSDQGSARRSSIIHEFSVYFSSRSAALDSFRSLAGVLPVLVSLFSLRNMREAANCHERMLDVAGEFPTLTTNRIKFANRPPLRFLNRFRVAASIQICQIQKLRRIDNLWRHSESEETAKAKPVRPWSEQQQAAAAGA
eukprot:768555-Hanusia_phi.AAC.10